MAKVLALTTAPDYGADLERHGEITLVATDGDQAGGIVGDRHLGKLRSVTVVCTGELAAAAVDYGIDQFDAVSTRRNIVVDLEMLPREHGARFSIGNTELAVRRDCAPCNLMDEFFGDGAKEALRQRCGISASVITGGAIRVGDPVIVH